MKTIHESYKTSTDYDRLVELILMSNLRVICFDGELVMIAEYAMVKGSSAYVVGHYCFRKMDEFIKFCKHLNLKFIEPNHK